MANANMNFTSSPGLVPTAVQQYLWRTFEPRVVNDRIYGRDFQIRPVPANSGDRVKFNRMNPFAVDLTPLKQGVTPDGMSIVTSMFTATAKPYGQYVTLNDEWDWYLLDSVKRETALRLGDQARDTIDAIDCNALKCGLNVQYGGGKTSRAALTTSDVLTFADIKKAVRTLEKNKAKPFDDGFYHAIVGPETAFDLTGDSLFVDIAKYQDKRNIERGEIGCMHKVKFFQSNMPMVFNVESYLYGNKASLTITAYDATNKVLTIANSSIGTNNEDIQYFQRAIAGKMVRVGGDVDAVIDRAVTDGENQKVYLRWIEDGYSFSASDTIAPIGAASSGAEVHGTIVYGKDFAGGISLAGGKNVQMIAKGLGSSGSDDPLNQRGTLGWKIKGYNATILEDAYIVRIEHGVSA